MQYLALCCIVKDEGPYIREWVLYHSLIGVEHFFIYDNGSTPPVRESLSSRDSLADMPHVTILNAPNRSMQLPAYNHCLTEFGNNFKWIAFIDVDEFICLNGGTDLRPLLAEYEPYAGLALSWRTFSSNGHETRPDGPVIENYTRYLKEEESVHIKSIVQPRKTAGCRNAHAFGYLNGEYCVDEAFNPIPGGAPFWLPSHKRAWVNHYYFKSREDFAHKLTRGRNSVHQENQPWWNMEIFNAHLTVPTLTDTTITRLAPRLKAALSGASDASPYLPPRGMNAGELVATAAERLAAGKPEEALACLCHAAAPQETHDIWTMRATFARLMRNLPAAAHFLRQAARMGESPHMYAEMAEFAFAKKDAAKSAAATALLGGALTRAGITEGQWADKLRELTGRLCG